MTAIEKAQSAWGRMPDWIKSLAEACDEASLRKVAGKLNVSPAIVSLAIGNKRKKLDFVKERVERTLMITIVACPVMGVMGREECLQEQARPFSSANPQRVRLFRACRDGCPHYKGERHEHSK